MTIKSARYFIVESFRNVFSNGWMSLASIFTTLASLLVFGVVMALGMNFSYISEQMEAEYQIIVMVDENCTDEEVAALGEEMRGLDNVARVDLDRRENRLQKLKADFGDNAFVLDGLETDNPLRNWYKLTLDDLADAERTVAAAETLSGVAQVYRNADVIAKIRAVSDMVNSISLWLMLALALVSIFIISNTIKLAVFARRKEINIMKFVGATDWFIRWPFIIEGVVIGFFGCIAAALILGCGYAGLEAVIVELEIHFLRLKPFSEMALPIGGAFLLIGAGLGGVGSLIAVRKHLQV
jgi:cell division transport system permease protein